MGMSDDAFDVSPIVLAPGFPLERLDDGVVVDGSAPDVFDPRQRIRIHHFVVQKPVESRRTLQPAITDFAFEDHLEIL